MSNTLIKDGDGRASPRRRMLKSAIAASNERRLTVNCVVRDLSGTGARLRIEGSMTVPDTFELIIPLDGLEASCQVVWRKGGEVGVKFLAPPRMVAAKRSQVVSPIAPPRPVSLRRPTPPQAGPHSGKQ